MDNGRVEQNRLKDTKLNVNFNLAYLRRRIIMANVLSKNANGITEFINPQINRNNYEK